MATRPIVDKSSAPPVPVSDRLQLAEELLELAERAQGHTRAAGTAVALKLGEKLYVRTSSGVAPEVGSSLLMGEGAIGQCARLGKPCNVSEEDKIDASLRVLGVRSLIAVPIHHAGIFYGVLVALAQTPEAFTRMQVAIMMTMGNEVARVLKRMEPAAMEIAPGAPLRTPAASAAIPDDNIIELSLTPTAKQDIVETLKNIEQKPTAAAKVTADKLTTLPQPKPLTAPVLTPAQVAVLSAPGLDTAASTAKPLPDLLPPGEDPRRYGTLKTAKPLQAPIFVTANAFVQPRPSSHMKAPAIAAAVLVIGAIGFGAWRQSATPAPNHLTAVPAAVATAPINAAPEPAPKSEAAVPAPAPAAVKADAPKKAAKAEEFKPEEKTVLAVAEEPLHLAAPAKHADLPAAEAPSLTLASTNSLPDLGTPKVAAARLLVKTTAATPPAILMQVKPSYPEIARRSGVVGNVRLEVSVSNTGKVSNVRVLDGPGLLRMSAVSAVSQWQYRPATMDGRPVASTLEVTVRFAQ